ncbi:interferon-induced, double-stranded RNA-activated protein kinase [Gracilinanus agilis]|uniref:interferon-induced, double-stranded RNA-activated protein kinase n=1 Tax=Gracilinanus agilis TaxID=191870 RepID=UPI001CFCC828|nr:interferon-induced, double-stranded RNA-activated protein kinase [Gracilinanus agilis]
MASNLPSGLHSAKLNEYCQKNSLAFYYKEVSVNGPPHNMEFTIKTVIGDREFPEGKGKSKKEAKNEAARLALDKLENKSSMFPVSPKSPLQQSEVSETERPSSPKYIILLNQYTQKKKLTVDSDTKTIFEPSGITRYSHRFKIGGKFYDVGWGSNKQEAKESAAKIAYEQLIANTSQDVNSFMSPQPSQSTRISDIKTSPTMNYISFLNQYTQKKRLTLNFLKVTSLGHSGPQSVSYICKIGDTAYDPGTGSNKKEAKEAAAKIAYEKIQLSVSDASEKRNSGILSGCATSLTDSINTPLMSLTLNGRTTESAYSEDASEQNSNNLESTSCSQNFVRSYQQKTKRILAPSFGKQNGNNEKKETVHSTNERFLKDFSDIEKLKSGGYGQVFKARHRIDKKFYAIKRVKFNDSKVLREVEALANLDHENIVKYNTCWDGYDAYNPERSGHFSSSKTKCLFISMELCEKGTLDDWINQRRIIGTDKTLSLNLFQQITAGVGYIHSEKLIHRDLKPSNIFLVDEIKIKIGDFGLVTSSKSKEDQTKNIGTERYISPEQICCLPYGNEVDIFALGLILFELLYICPTVQEIWKIWKNVRDCVFPEEFIKNYIRETWLLKQLLAEKPTDRLKASKILKTLKEWEKDDIKKMYSYSY